MDKKGILVLIAAAAALIFFQFNQAKQIAEYRAAKAAYDAEMARLAEIEAANKATEVKPGEFPANPTPAKPTAPLVEEKRETFATKAAEYTFTNLGGGISRAKLAEHIIDKKNSANVVLNEFSSTPIGAMSTVAGESVQMPYTVQRDDAAGTITFERVDEKQLALTKRFVLPKVEGKSSTDRLRDEYLVQLDVTFQNRSTAPVDVPRYWIHNGGAAPLHQYDAPLFIGFNYFRGSSNKFTNLSWFAESNFLFFFHQAARPVYPEKPEEMTDVRWTAVSNQYFSTLIAPRVDLKASSDVQTAARGTGVWARRTVITPESWSKTGRSFTPGGAELHGVEGALQVGGFKLEPNASTTRTFDVFVGPSEYRRLRQLENYETELLDFGMFGLISKGLLNSLNGLKSMLGSYWGAIIVLTIIIRSCMWPLQNRANQTAKKMQALSPKLKELQEKYKDDPMRMQQETSKLWKQYGINPLGGCLPMLVQIPIFFGFYSMLNKAVELRNNGFLWVHDLSQPDTVGHIPLLGFPINVLPLIMAATMMVQMRMMPKAGDPMQQKIMMFMPLLFVGLCYNYAAALALYWSVQNLFSIVQLWVTQDKGGTGVEIIPPPAKPNTKKR